MKKKPTKPYKGDRKCEAHVGVDYSQRSPRIIRCKNPAEYVFTTYKYKTFKDGYTVLVCAKCLVRFQEQENKNV